MPDQARTRRNRYIEIQIAKCRVFLTPEEMSRLLQKDPDLFSTGLRRGKAILRARKAQNRKGKEKECQNTRD